MATQHFLHRITKIEPPDLSIMELLVIMDISPMHALINMLHKKFAAW